jgi:type III pantothenate kinase
MLLVIDAGNTETVFGLYRDEALVSRWRMSSHSGRTADEAWVLLRGWCDTQGLKPEDIRDAVISSVVPDLTALFSDMVLRHLRIRPLIVSSDTDTGIPIRTEAPATVGADRICNAVGGLAKYGAPLVVVDFGTAITFDVISGKGEYLGGLIGLGLRGAALELHRVAAKLPRVDLVFPPAVIGRNTETCIQAGLLWGAAAMVDGLISRIAGELGLPDVAAVATGGMADLVSSQCARIRHVDPFLTLEGMRIIHSRAATRTEPKSGGI